LAWHIVPVIHVQKIGFFTWFIFCVLCFHLLRLLLLRRLLSGWFRFFSLTVLVALIVVLLCG
jgi:hypothetical protein